MRIDERIPPNACDSLRGYMRDVKANAELAFGMISKLGICIVEKNPMYQRFLQMEDREPQERRFADKLTPQLSPETLERCRALDAASGIRPKKQAKSPHRGAQSQRFQR